MAAGACAKKIACDCEAAAMAEAGTELAKLGLLSEAEMEELAKIDQQYIQRTKTVIDKAISRLNREGR